MDDLIKRLKEEGYNFNFFQALSLLEEKYSKFENISKPIENGKIRLNPSPSLSFPASDIAQVLETKNGIKFVLTFMGLLGVSSPLPLYFTEYVLRHEENANSLYDFICIFNHRLYTLFYRAWQKYRFINIAFNLHENPLSYAIASLCGLNKNQIKDPFYFKILAYTGAFCNVVRSKESLRAILVDYFGGLPIKIYEWQSLWTEIKDLPKIGENFILGQTSVIGTKKLDIAGNFRVSVGPLPREIFEKFLRNSQNIQEMKKIIDMFLTDPLKYDIEVKMESVELIPVILGQNQARLGETTSLGKSNKKSEIKSVVIE